MPVVTYQARPCNCGQIKLEALEDRGSVRVECPSCHRSSGYHWCLNSAIVEWNEMTSLVGPKIPKT